MMEWIGRLNGVIGYIEGHLEEKIDYGRIASIACCSIFHFQMMFSYLAGMSLSEYIRRRRMSRAALDLQNGRATVMEVALKYGYDSPTAFNRAFKSVHGITPSSAKRPGAVLKSFPPISFKITIKGDSEMNYSIEKKEAFRIVGVKERYVSGSEESLKKLPQFWTREKENGIIKTLCPLNDIEPRGILGVCSPLDGQYFDYYIATASGKKAKGLSELIIPAGTWAIFECVGPMPGAIQQMSKRIFSEWLPTSGYEYENSPDIEFYTEGDMQAKDYLSEIWLPVTKK